MIGHKSNRLTALGINNSGDLTLTYGYEDTDFITSEGQVSTYAFNAAKSVFWCRIRDLMYDELKAVYEACQSCWNPESLIQEFDEWQNQFPEELWRKDIERKYYRPSWNVSVDNSIPKSNDYLTTMFEGRKKYQRRQYERDQAVYIRTKYIPRNDDTIILRFRNVEGSVVLPPDYTLHIVPYINMYIYAAYGNTASSGQITGETRGRHIRAVAGQEYELVNPFSGSEMQDTQVVIHGASRIQSLNDLSACYIEANNFENAVKLQQIVAGNKEISGYSNPYINGFGISGNNSLLEVIDISNCSSLDPNTNLGLFTNLREFYAEGTMCTTVSFAPYGRLEIAHLPSSVNVLSMRYLSYLEELSCPSYQAISSLTVESTPNVPVLDIIDEATSPRYLRLTDIELDFRGVRDKTGEQWTINEVEALFKKIDGCKDTQNQNNDSIISGVAYFNQLRDYEEIYLRKRYPQLDLQYESILWTYRFRDYETGSEFSVVPYSLRVAYDASLFRFGEHEYETGGWEVSVPTDSDVRKPMDNDTYTFAFTGWKDNNASGDNFTPQSEMSTIRITNDNRAVDYSAVYGATFKEYSVAFSIFNPNYHRRVNYYYYSSDDSDIWTLIPRTYHWDETVKLPGEDILSPTPDYFTVNGNIDYTFSSSTEAPCKGAVVYRAEYSSLYSVSFCRAPGDPINEHSDLLFYNNEPIKSMLPPVSELYKEQDEKYTYEFVGWTTTPSLGGTEQYIGDGDDSTPANSITIYTNAELPSATTNVVYYAVYRRTYIDYSIVFINYGGSVISRVTNYHYGDGIVFPSDPTIETPGSVFAHWQDENNDTYTSSDAIACSGSMVYRAKYLNSEGTLIDEGNRLITFYNGSTYLSSAEVTYGHEVENIPLPTMSDPIYTYSLIGWGLSPGLFTGDGDDSVSIDDITVYASSELPLATQDATYYAVYNRALTEYTVTFINIDNPVPDIPVTYHYNDAVTIPEVTYSGGSYHSYEFKNWVNSSGTDIDTTAGLICTGNQTYRAKYIAYSNTVSSKKLMPKTTYSESSGTVWIDMGSDLISHPSGVQGNMYDGKNSTYYSTTLRGATDSTWPNIDRYGIYRVNVGGFDLSSIPSMSGFSSIELHILYTKSGSIDFDSDTAIYGYSFRNYDTAGIDLELTYFGSGTTSSFTDGGLTHRVRTYSDSTWDIDAAKTKTSGDIIISLMPKTSSKGSNVSGTINIYETYLVLNYRVGTIIY